MLVQRIEVNPTQNITPETGGRGQVAFVTEMGDMMFECHVKPGRSPEKRNPTLALISEALRQAKRMPEYRISKSFLSFAPGVLPEGLPN